MKHYLVSWENHRGLYRDLIVYAEDAAHAKTLVKAAYHLAANIKARRLGL